MSTVFLIKIGSVLLNYDSVYDLYCHVYKYPPVPASLRPFSDKLRPFYLLSVLLLGGLVVAHYTHVGAVVGYG